MNSDETAIAGRPIRGEIEYYDDPMPDEDPEYEVGPPVEQKPLTDFLTALDAVFAFPEVQSIRWEQYTPYFNDGEPCEFGPESPGFRIDGVDADEDEEDEDGHINFWSIRSAESRHQRDVAEFPQISDALFAAMDALDATITEGAHDTDLWEYFGDPAQVTATRAGFDVEFYEHD